jgi:streptogramin lyase
LGVGGAGGAIDAPAEVAPPPDLAAVPDLPPGDLGAASCGGTHVNLNGITATPALAMDTDGTLYFIREMGTQVWVGRVLPGQAPDPSWKALPASVQIRGMIVDGQRKLLYLANFSGNAIFSIKTTDSMPAATATGVAAPHGLAVGDDGFLYVTISDGQVLRMSPDLAGWNVTHATAMPMFPAGQRGLALAFGPSGDLFVGSSSGAIKRFRVAAGKLSDPVDQTGVLGAVNALAFDIDGRLYVASTVGTTSQALNQIAPGALVALPVVGVTGRLSALAFGRGALDCHDLYVADLAGAAKRVMVAQPGLGTR